MITVTITRAELEAANACSAGESLAENGMALFNVIAKKGGDAECITVPDWTALHQLWLSATYPSHYAWLRNLGLVPQVSMAGANLRGANLAFANLRGANLASANLASADLKGADLRGASLTGANLAFANLAHANLKRANLESANLESANLTRANLDFADLAFASLAFANLEGARRARGSTIPGWIAFGGRLVKG